MNPLSIEDARKILGEIVDRARLAGEHTRITRQGKAAAVVVGVEWYEDEADLTAMAIQAVERGGFTVGDMEMLTERYRDRADALRKQQAAERRDKQDPGTSKDGQ